MDKNRIRRSELEAGNGEVVERTRTYVDKALCGRNVLLQAGGYIDLRDKRVLTHTLFALQPDSRNPDSHRVYDLLRADFTLRDVVEPVADDLVQSSVEFLHRNVLQFPVSY